MFTIRTTPNVEIVGPLVAAQLSLTQRPGAVTVISMPCTGRASDGAVAPARHAAVGKEPPLVPTGETLPVRKADHTCNLL